MYHSFKQQGCYHDYGPWTDDMIELWLCLYVDGVGGGVSWPVWAIIGDFRKLISYTPHAQVMAMALSVLIKTTFICMISCVYSSIFFNI